MNSGWVSFDDVRMEVVMQTTTIDYAYDPLYRLTGATHTGAIEAEYSYVYDAVGNMTTYTETVGAETSSVNRSFNDANQLVTATDAEAGTTSFTYDDNGNLVEIWPPGASQQDPAGIVSYGFNQRNLLITQSTYISDTGWTLQAEFAYDGESNRVQQIDHTGQNPVTTTYHNDNAGLSQVLVSSNGITTTHNLFGLDLIHVDDGSQTRTLLADGLGSTRVEMVDGAVETTTTYEPYGKVLAQTGPSGTVYGYTGEQYNTQTGLVYLRARYYNTYLNQFQSRDPWRGNVSRPETLNGFNYVGGNPINFVDPTGLRPCSSDNFNPELCVPDLSPPYGNTKGLFNFKVLPGQPNSEIIANIEVEYQDMPWLRYARPSAPFSPVSIPVRHPLNLLEENPLCGGSLEAAKAFYASGVFTTWEVNARNLMQEMGGVITSQKPWALRDAIGLAYVPYNRVAFNALPPEMRFNGDGSPGASFKSDYGNDAFGLLLGGDGQFAGLSTKGYYAALTGDYGGNSLKLYHFSLVVSYGVDKRYFFDTSHGATTYFHRPYNSNDEDQTPEYGHCEVTGEYYSYAFFKNQRLKPYGFNRYQPTSAELAASRSGWRKWIESGNVYTRVEWTTPYPPEGCNYNP